MHKGGAIPLENPTFDARRVVEAGPAICVSGVGGKLSTFPASFIEDGLL